MKVLGKLFRIYRVFGVPLLLPFALNMIIPLLIQLNFRAGVLTKLIQVGKKLFNWIYFTTQRHIICQKISTILPF